MILELFYGTMILLPNAVGPSDRYGAAMDAARSASMEASGVNYQLKRFGDWFLDNLPVSKATLGTGFYVYNIVKTRSVSVSFPIFDHNSNTVHMTPESISMDMTWSI